MDIYHSFLSLSVSFFVTILIIPWLIANMKKKGFIGRDMNKVENIEIPEMGGIAVVIGFMAGVYSLLFLDHIYNTDNHFSDFFLASLITLIGIAFTGLLDDLLDMRQRTKAVLPFIFSLPLGIYASEVMYFPFLGEYDFGSFMLFIVPFGVTCAANSMNMLEGFNGLGTSLGIIITITMITLSLMNKVYDGLDLLFPLLGGLLAFLIFNRYPSKIFPGDTLTLFLGATIGCASIMNDLRFEGIILLSPMIAEFFLKSKGNFQAQCFAEEIIDGNLVYRGRIESLTHLVMKNTQSNEKHLVLIFVFFEILLGTFVISLSYFNYL